MTPMLFKVVTVSRFRVREVSREVASASRKRRSPSFHLTDVEQKDTQIVRTARDVLMDVAKMRAPAF